MEYLRPFHPELFDLGGGLGGSMAGGPENAGGLRDCWVDVDAVLGSTEGLEEGQEGEEGEERNADGESAV